MIILAYSAKFTPALHRTISNYRYTEGRNYPEQWNLWLNTKIYLKNQAVICQCDTARNFKPFYLFIFIIKAFAFKINSEYVLLRNPVFLQWYESIQSYRKTENLFDFGLVQRSEIFQPRDLKDESIKDNHHIVCVLHHAAYQRRKPYHFR